MKQFEIKQAFARSNKLPILFVGEVIRQTERAVYIYGHGTTETKATGRCCICGRTLTHPVSVELGIGPECGGHFWDWNAIGGYTMENVERLKGKLEEIKVDQWFPKSIIVKEVEIQEQIEIPQDHKMLQQQEQKDMKKQAIQIQNEKTGIALIKISFPFDRQLVDKVKTLDYRLYKPTEKVWTCALSTLNIQKLDQWGFELDEKLKKYLEYKPVEIKELPPLMDIQGLGGTLREYQGQGVAFIEKMQGRALIADEMGLGKTVQALAYLQQHPEQRPALIVTPGVVKYKWVRETKKWLSNPGNIQILSGRTQNERIYGDIVFINYDILHDWQKILHAADFKVMVTDEVQYYKTNSAKRTQAVKKLGKTIPNLIGLSGTPIENRPIEIYNFINLARPDLFPNFMAFAKKYCKAHHNGWGWDFSGASNIPELNKILCQNIMIRRLKKDVLKELPELQYVYVPLELSNRKEYDHAHNDFIHYVKATKGQAAAEKASQAETLVRLSGLKKLSADGKLEQIINWIEDFFETKDKLVVAAWHQDIINAIVQHFGPIASKIDGTVPVDKRDIISERFQHDPANKLIVINMKAGGVGIDLFAAEDIAVIELPWAPGILDQAIARIHRMGQKQSATAHYLLGVNTIDETLAELIDKKRNIISQVMDGVEVDQEELITELINNLITV